MTTMMKPEYVEQEQELQIVPVRTNRKHINRKLRQMDLETLYRERHHYRRPRYQREKVASYRDKQLIFLSIILGIPLDALQCELGIEPNTNAYVRYIMNGWQRFNAFIEIMENKVTLPSKAAIERFLPNSPIVDEVKDLCGLSFKRLGAEYQQDIRDFDIWTVIMGDVPYGWQPDIFRLVNQHRALSVGDHLASRLSDAQAFAHELTNWEKYGYWSACWRHSPKLIEDTRRTRFTSVLEMFMIEAAERPYTMMMREGNIMPWASGIYDHLLTERFLERVKERMEVIARVFKGANTIARTEAIAMYQAARLLEDRGYALAYSEEGCLTPWLVQARKRQSLGTASHYNVIAHFNNKADQDNFWTLNLPWIEKNVKGLVKTSQVDEGFIAELATSGRL